MPWTATLAGDGGDERGTVPLPTYQQRIEKVLEGEDPIGWYSGASYGVQSTVRSTKYVHTKYGVLRTPEGYFASFRTPYEVASRSRGLQVTTRSPYSVLRTSHFLHSLEVILHKKRCNGHYRSHQKRSYGEYIRVCKTPPSKGSPRSTSSFFRRRVGYIPHATQATSVCSPILLLFCQDADFPLQTVPWCSSLDLQNCTVHLPSTTRVTRRSPKDNKKATVPTSFTGSSGGNIPPSIDTQVARQDTDEY